MSVRVLRILIVSAALTATSVAGVTSAEASGATAAASVSSSKSSASSGSSGSSGWSGSSHDWSTAPRSVTRTHFPAPEVTGIRVGRHLHFDRIVIDLHGAAPGYRVRYVRALHRDPSGQTVHLLGPRSLRIVLSANGHDGDTGRSTLTTPSRTAWHFGAVRETAVLGDFEAVFSLGVGLAHTTPFRVQTLHQPTRIVVDVRQ